MFKIKLRTKILAGTVGLVLILGLGVIFFIQTMLLHNLREELQKRGVSIAHYISETLVGPLLSENRVDLQIQIHEYKKLEEEMEYIFVLSPKGEVLAHTFEEGFPEELKNANPIQPQQAQGIQTLITEQGKIFDIAVPVLKGELGTLHIGFLEVPIRKGIAHILKPLIVILLGVFVIAGGVTILLVTFITRPISKLVAIAQAVSQGDFQHKIQIRTKDEIEELGNHFNKMMDDLSRLVEREKELAATSAAAREAEKKAREIEVAYRKLKEVQTQLVHAGRLAAVGELAAGIAHEINNPLAAILGQAQLLFLQAEHKEWIDAKTVHETCKSIETSSKRCKAITEGLLNFSRKGVALREKVDLSEVVEATTGLIAKQLHVDNVTLVKQLHPELPPVWFNKLQLQQVILNLISNARDAIVAKKSPGTLTITTDIDPQKKEVRAIFKDTGGGISKENKQKLFQPFFTTKEPGEGTGLGLAICYGIVKEQGGRIEVESEVGKGSTFKIIFPVAAS